MKDYARQFVNEQDGIETIEFLGMIAVAALLIFAVLRIGSALRGKATEAQGKLSATMQSALNQMK